MLRRALLAAPRGVRLHHHRDVRDPHRSPGIDPIVVELMRQMSDLQHTVAQLQHHVLREKEEKKEGGYFPEDGKKP
jgi:hypothetical protein